jgi:hypothetical protein
VQTLNKPNPEQHAAATALADRSTLVLAGAGSGKTRVLTTRIAWLIQTGQASPGGLLAVTFTNKAAMEMLTRISVQLPINTHGTWVGTFHGLCNRFLRAHYCDAELPQTFQKNGLLANVCVANDNFACKYCEIYAADQAQCRREGIVDFYTRQSFAGGQSHTVDAPLGKLPLFARAGAALATSSRL